MTKQEICKKFERDLIILKSNRNHFNRLFDLAKKNKRFDTLKKIKYILEKNIEKLRQDVAYEIPIKWTPLSDYND